MAKKLGRTVQVIDPPNILDPNLHKVAGLMGVNFMNTTQFYTYGVTLLSDKMVEVKSIETETTTNLPDKSLKLIKLWIISRPGAKWEQLIEVAKGCSLGGLESTLNAEFTSPEEPQKGNTVPGQGKYAGEIKVVADHYKALTALNADAILPSLVASGVITFTEKPEIDVIQLQKKKMEHLIVKIIVPSLEADVIKKFEGLVQVMEGSDDITIRTVGKDIRRSLK